MIRFALTKFVGFVATLLVAAAIVFFALDLLPGDTARFILGINATPDAVAALQAELGLDAPSWQRFFGWIGGMLVGDFGLSYSQAQPVGQLIGDRLGVTLPLALMAMVLAIVIGLPVGVLSARKRGSLLDIGLTVLARLGVATPNFWLGMLLVLLFSATLRWFPPGGFVPWGQNPGTAFASLVLPAIALALPQAAIFASAMRQALIDVQDSDFIRASRAKGLTLRGAVWRHGMRSALLPVLAIVGMQLGYLVAGTVIVENVFYLPGLGRLILDAISARDLILVRSSVIVLIILIVGTMFFTRLAAALIDPRLRARKAA